MKKLITGIAIFYYISGQAQSSFNVYFDFNKYTLTEACRVQLDSFLLAEKEGLQLIAMQLNGYCDAIGTDGYNDKLSGQRVAAIKKYFISKGIEERNIGDEIAHGKRDPVNENRTEEERQLNRRVDISFKKVVPDNLPGVTTLKEKLADSTIKSGTTIALRNINFVGGLHQFLPVSAPMLEELLDAMKTYPNLVIRIEGHICCQEGTDDGMDGETGIFDLSAARAKAVMEFLLRRGITPDRLSFKGFGHSAPIYPYPEKTEEERIANRRVEIKIIRK